jgi:hypothetical protein
LDQNIADIVAIIGAATGVIGILLAVIALLRLRRMRRDYTLLQGPDPDGASFVAAVARKVEAVEQLRAELSTANSRIAGLRADLASAIRHVVVVRYDAFGDMGGRLSFSAAMLDDAGDGLVLTSIHGRTETRSYAKGVKGGASEMTLSPEEEQAVGYAMRRATAPGRSG